MADFDICPKCKDDFIRGNTCINCGYEAKAKEKADATGSKKGK